MVNDRKWPGFLGQVDKQVFFSVVAMLAAAGVYILIDTAGAQSFFTNLYAFLLVNFS